MHEEGPDRWTGRKNGSKAPPSVGGPPDRPAIPEVGVMAFVPDSWRGFRQPRHQVLFRLARYFHVAWIEPLPHWRELLDGSPPQPGDGIRMEDLPEGLLVDDPKPRIPFVHRPRSLGQRLLRSHWSRARRRLVRSGCRRILLYLWRPAFGGALHAVPHDASAYHIDDEYTFSHRDRPIPEEERRVLEEVDQVFIHSPALLEKKGHLNARTRFVPNGVDYRAYSTPSPEPADLAEIPGPRVGYAGMLKTQLDWDLLEALARRHRDWSFVFVGATARQPEMEETVRRMRELPNAHFLGPKSTVELARYPQHFDVCLMPYRLTDYTRYINPLKLYEYLASGRPVLASRLPSLEPFGDLVPLLDPRPDDWSSGIEHALRRDDGGEERQERARRYDWDLLVHGVAEDLAELAEPGLGQRLPPMIAAGSESSAHHPS